MRRLPRFLLAMTAMAASYALGMYICSRVLQRRSAGSPRRPVTVRDLPMRRESPAARRKTREPAPYEQTATLARQAMFGGSS